MRYRLRLRRIVLTLLLCLLVLIPRVSADPAPVVSDRLLLPLVTRRANVGAMYTVGQRFGVGLSGHEPTLPHFAGRLSAYPMARQLGFGWYSDWSMSPSPEKSVGGMPVEYVQVIDTRNEPDCSLIQGAVAANPGSLWIIGNEPEIESQGANTPEEYAERYHKAYSCIKEHDPTAQVAIGGVVMPTPLRLRWLEQSLAYYETTYGERMPIDVWNIHVQILPEGLGYGCGLPKGLHMDPQEQMDLARNFGATPEGSYFGFNADPAIFQELVSGFREWLYAREEHTKPLIISEYGVLYPSDYLVKGLSYAGDPFEAGDRMVESFMRETFEFMLTARDDRMGCPADGGRLVQRWLWFSLNVPLIEWMPDDPNTPEVQDGYWRGYNGPLLNWETGKMTRFGLAYRDSVAAAKAGTLAAAEQAR